MWKNPLCFCGHEIVLGWPVKVLNLPTAPTEWGVLFYSPWAELIGFVFMWWMATFFSPWPPVISPLFETLWEAEPISHSWSLKGHILFPILWSPLSTSVAGVRACDLGLDSQIYLPWTWNWNLVTQKNWDEESAFWKWLWHCPGSRVSRGRGTRVRPGFQLPVSVTPHGFSRSVMAGVSMLS